MSWCISQSNHEAADDAEYRAAYHYRQKYGHGDALGQNALDEPTDRPNDAEKQINHHDNKICGTGYKRQNGHEKQSRAAMFKSVIDWQ